MKKTIIWQGDLPKNSVNCGDKLVFEVNSIADIKALADKVAHELEVGGVGEKIILSIGKDQSK